MRSVRLLDTKAETTLMETFPATTPDKGRRALRVSQGEQGMKKSFLFALAALLATMPVSSVAQTYSYYFDSATWTNATTPFPPVTRVVTSWESAGSIASCSNVTPSSVSISPPGSGYKVISVNLCNTGGIGVLSLAMTDSKGNPFTGLAKASTPITGALMYPLVFAFTDPPSDPEDTLQVAFKNASLTITNLSLPIVEWCEICQVYLRLHPEIPIENPLEGTVEFTAPNGALLGPAQRVTVGPGQVASVEFQPGQAGSGTHLDMIPVVTINGGGSPAPPVQVTAEVLDASGSGVLLVSNSLSVPAAGLIPQSIASGQIMRLIARATSPNPCVATLGFSNAAGAPIGPQTSINLGSGQAYTLDLDASALSLGQGQGAVVQPIAQIIPAAGAAASSVCSVTSEVFDAGTGQPGTYQNALLQ
jgi:hypothetical protein